jgi:hypothetical protein
LRNALCFVVYFDAQLIHTHLNLFRPVSTFYYSATLEMTRIRSLKTWYPNATAFVLVDTVALIVKQW